MRDRQQSRQQPARACAPRHSPVRDSQILPDRDRVGDSPSRAHSHRDESGSKLKPVTRHWIVRRRGVTAEARSAPTPRPIRKGPSRRVTGARTRSGSRASLLDPLQTDVLRARSCCPLRSSSRTKTRRKRRRREKVPPGLGPPLRHRLLLRAGRQRTGLRDAVAWLLVPY